jgi:hypothetical protein
MDTDLCGVPREVSSGISGFAGVDMTLETRKPGTMPDKPLSCEPLVEILKRKMKGEKGIARKWIKCKLRELTR